MIRSIKQFIKNRRDELAVLAGRIKGSPPWSAKATLAMEVSGYCNLRCPMCSYPRMKREKGFMDWNLFCKIVRDAKENGHDIASLHFFGEPLLWPHIIDGVKLLSQNQFFPRISTNGMLLTGETAKKLQDAGLKEIMVTIDTLLPEVYEKIRTGGNFEIVRNNIHEAIKAAPDLLITAQLMPTKDNAHETEDDFYSEFGRKSNFKVEPWFVIRMNDSESLSDVYTHSPDEVDKRLCNKIFDRLDVLWDGTTVLCCLDSEGRLVTGNLNRNTISYSWIGPQAMHLRKIILQGQWTKLPACKQCAADHIVNEREDWKNFPHKPLPLKYKALLNQLQQLDQYNSTDDTWSYK